MTHNETATGVKSDVAAVRRAMDACEHPAMLFADCVSSLASMDFRMDEWGVDVAVTGSQKGFMLPTGMAIVGTSQKALEAVKTSASRASSNPAGGSGKQVPASFPGLPATSHQRSRTCPGRLGRTAQ